jgi:prepilin-type N-terminal cleavage/methylation domain-containing protein
MMTGHRLIEKGSMSTAKGFTLVELIVVVAIMGILFAIATLSWQSMRARYNVEKQTKQIYTDMMNARLRAIQRDRSRFAVFPSAAASTTYGLYEDPSPDGNGQFVSTATDSLVGTYNLLPTYSLELTNPSMTVLRFTGKGLVDQTQAGAIKVQPTAGGEYDCIQIDQITTGMGKWNATTNQCDVK